MAVHVPKHFPTMMFIEYSRKNPGNVHTKHLYFILFFEEKNRIVNNKSSPKWYITSLNKRQITNCHNVVVTLVAKFGKTFFVKSIIIN